MENEKDWLKGYGLNIFSFFRILKIKRAIKNGEKTARNYCILADWYSMFGIFNKTFSKKALLWGLMAIRADKTYPPAYLLSADAYSRLNIKTDLQEKYAKIAINLGGNEFYRAKSCLIGALLDNQKIVEAYNLCNDFLSNKTNQPEYLGISLQIIAAFYGYGIEYKNASLRFINYFVKNKILPKPIDLIIFFISLKVLGYSKRIANGKSSLMLEALIEAEEYENRIALINKLIIRERRTKTDKNTRLAYLYQKKATALMYQDSSNYNKALEILEKMKEYGNKEDIILYYYLRANYAYIAHDYNNALIYVNEALLNKIHGENLLLKGLICHALAQYKESKEVLIKALEYENCDKGTAYHYLCEDYYALGEHQEALHYINQALIINQDAKSYYAKANILEALGRIKESQEYFDKYNEIIKEKSN